MVRELQHDGVVLIPLSEKDYSRDRGRFGVRYSAVRCSSVDVL